ncbi:hypothetical protein, partial [Acidithiobacillus caldus]|uniref:hypothetical protein n=1 Tax=Acidithiobacillus caldus TaxID=33059 RepID=UPI0007DA3242
MLLFIVAAAASGFVWRVGYLGPILSVLLVPLVVRQKTRWSRYAVALSYYLAGSSGIPQASAVFFGPGHLGEGVLLWLGSSALLAAGWAFADSAWKAILVLLFDALVPPLSFFDWMSPLSAAGVFFPWSGIFGVVLLLVWIPSVAKAWRERRGWVPLVLVPLALNLTAVVIHRPPLPSRIEGVHLNVGPSTPSLLKNVERLHRWVAVADRHKKAKILLLPETLVTWWSGNAAYIERHVPEGQIWLVGASIPLDRPGVFADGIEAVTSHGSKMVFGSVLPVPVSMWRPWHTPSDAPFGQNYKAYWWPRRLHIAGDRLVAEICYDQLLPFTWLEDSLYLP